MKINKTSLLSLCEEIYGYQTLVKDFHGNYMFRDTFGDRNAYRFVRGEKVFCGWNLHHIPPKM